MLRKTLSNKLATILNVFNIQLIASRGKCRMHYAMLSQQHKIAFMAVVILLSFAAALPLAVAQQSDAATAIASTKNQFVTCLQAAEDAEAAGANVTSLLNTLTEAGLLLSRAELAYSKNDFGTARSLAVQSQDELSGFVSEASSLKEAAVQQRNMDFLINVVGSTVATFAVIGVGAGVWYVLGRKRGESGE
jgi:hypothetical protein